MKLMLLIGSVNKSKVRARVQKVEGPMCTIGRIMADVELKDVKCAGSHAILCMNEREELLLHDLCSQNGTYCEGARINHRVLAVGDRFRIGDTVIKVLAVQKEERLPPPVVSWPPLLRNLYHNTLGQLI